MRLNFYITFSFFFLFLSCSRVIEIDSANYNPLLVLSGIVHPGTSGELMLTSNYQATDYKPNNWVMDASITVLNSGQIHGYYKENLTDSGKYVYSGEPFIEGETYSIEAVADGYPTATAQVTLPVKTLVKIKNTEWQNHNDTTNIIRFNGTLSVTIEFDDQAGIENYYKLSAKSGYYFNDKIYYNQTFRDTISFVEHEAQIWSKNPMVEISENKGSFKFVQNEVDWEGTSNSIYPYHLYGTDLLIDGNQTVMPIEVEISDIRKEMYLYVTLSTIGEEYYQLARSIAAYEKVTQSFFNDPITMFSNVKNGLGYWAAENTVTDSIQFFSGQ